MTARFSLLALLLAACLACTPQSEEQTATQAAAPGDPHSLSNPHAVRVRHLHLDLTADFSSRTLSGTATLDLKRIEPDADAVVLDTRNLAIGKVEAATGEEWREVAFTLQHVSETLGSALRIGLPAGADKVRIEYQTSPEATGLQWLNPAQTASKQQPFLFSQSQAIHARSWVPLQDTPQVRFTYSATVRTPQALKAVMSAENDPNDRDGAYEFRMPQPIPSYLMAIGIGDLVFQSMSERTGVYAEPPVVEAAAREFGDTERMMQISEKLYGPYRWGRYDLLILPPSFPFGGMENPRLSFITPTVIAGDKSLVALIAHELAHSWSGNLVTNATWRDLWLNEGFTTFLTYRIMEAVYGERRMRMERVLGYQDLQQDLATLPPGDTILAIDLQGRDPDDVFSDVPYEKGALFLTWLEEKFGRETFDAFLLDYFNHFAFQSISTEQFLDYLQAKLLDKHSGAVTLEQVHAWVYEPGLPSDHPLPQSDAFEKVQEARQTWLAGRLQAAEIPTAEWTTHEWLYFLNTLPVKLAPAQLQELDAAFSLTQSPNSEIAHSWLLIAIRNNYQPAFGRLERYLIQIGRRKLIKPLYEELMKTPEGAEFARGVYEQARPGYHPLAQNTLDAIVLRDERRQTAE